MAENENIKIRVYRLTSGFTPRRRTSLVYNAQPHSLHLDCNEFRQPLTQNAMVIVSGDTQQSVGSRTQCVEYGDVDPVAGVEDEVRLIDGAPHFTWQVLGAFGHVRVSKEEQAGCHAPQSTLATRPTV